MNTRLICSLLVLNLLSVGAGNSYASGKDISKKSLECLTCYSQRSWSDCHRSSRVHNCPSFLDSCMTVHRVARHRDGRMVHEFAKSCFIGDLCTTRFCEQGTSNETQVICRVLNCCLTSLCNNGLLSSSSQGLRSIQNGEEQEKMRNPLRSPMRLFQKQ